MVISDYFVKLGVDSCDCRGWTVAPPPPPSPSSPFLIIKLKLVSMAMTAWSQYSRHCNCSIMHRQNCQEDKVCLLSTNICCAHLSSHHNLVQKISSPSPPSANSEIKFSISCNLKMHSTLLPSEKQGKNFCPNFVSLWTLTINWRTR